MTTNTSQNTGMFQTQSPQDPQHPRQQQQQQQQQQQPTSTIPVISKKDVSSSRRLSAQSSVHSLTLSEGSNDHDIDRLDRSDRSIGLISRNLQSKSSNHPSSSRGGNAHAQVKQPSDPSTNMASATSVRLASSTSKMQMPSCLLSDKQPKAPIMKDPQNCNLFCAFYAEFDNVVGPKVSYQAPKYFMDHDVAITTTEIEQLLAKSFKTKTSSYNMTEKRNGDSDDNDCSNQGLITPKEKEGSSNKQHESNMVHVEDQPSNHDSTVLHHHDKSEIDHSDDLHGVPVVPQNSQSMFDSTCEYIITGKELSGQIISLSTHNVHIITRPTVIEDERYDRNSLLFSVGFVIRRRADPTPYRPLLSRLASALRSMEIESRFLSSSNTKPRIQKFLDVIVPSLNSQSAKCHLLLDEANALHIQYFPPPKVHAPPVPEYAVPVLLRPEFMLQSLDWDLTINWIVPHINGIKHAKLIAESSKVDEAMVLSCLRVLRHHNVLACVDIFRYSNIYESTKKAQNMLAGEMTGLLSQAYQFVAKHAQLPQPTTPSPTNTHMACEGMSLASPGNSTAWIRTSKSLRRCTKGGKVGNTVTLLAPLSAPASYPPIQPTLLHPMNMNSVEVGVADNINAASYTSGCASYNIVKGNSSPPSGTMGSRYSQDIGKYSEQVPTTPLSLQSNTPISVSFQGQDMHAYPEKDPTSMMTALAILYASCHRDMTIGDVLTSRIQENDDHSTEDSFLPSKRQSKPNNKQTKNRSKVRSASLASSGTSSCSEAVGNIDWKEVFNYFDHRRFVTFGIIHGLLRRVHEYPIAIKSESSREGRTVTQHHKTMDDLHQSKRQNKSQHFTSLRRHKSLGLDYTSDSTDSTGISPPFYPKPYPTQSSQNIGTSSTIQESLVRVKSYDGLNKGLSTHSISSIATAKSSHVTGSLAKNIANAMDGSRCDDELCCMFQKSMKELKNLVKKYTGNRIVSVYSSTDEK